MKRSGSLLPLCVLLAAWVAFGVYVWTSAPQLPARVATHFGMHGRADGWMTREGHTKFMLFAGFGVSVLMLLVFSIIRAKQGAGFNIPHREYWLAPERRADTLEIMQRSGLWIASLLIAFFAGLQHLVISANARVPASLPGSEFVTLIGALLAAVAIWALILFRRFRRPVA